MYKARWHVQYTIDIIVIWDHRNTTRAILLVSRTYHLKSKTCHSAMEDTSLQDGDCYSAASLTTELVLSLSNVTQGVQFCPILLNYRAGQFV